METKKFYWIVPSFIKVVLQATSEIYLPKCWVEFEFKLKGDCHFFIFLPINVTLVAYYCGSDQTLKKKSLFFRHFQFPDIFSTIIKYIKWIEINNLESISPQCESKDFQSINSTLFGYHGCNLQKPWRN